MRCFTHIAVVVFSLLTWHMPEVWAQVCSCDNYGNELVYNGDFSLGNTGFTTDYTNAATASPGRYGIVTDPNQANVYWESCTDHSGTGNLFWVDAASSTSINIWSQTITGLNPNKDYLFSCWLSTLDATAPGVLQFSVNSSLIGDSLVAPDSTCEWVLFCALWNSGSNTSATITITNQSQFVYGNDVGIDEISFKECCNDVAYNQEAFFCQGTDYQLPGGDFVNMPGTYMDSFTTTLGCDSVIITALGMLPVSSFVQNVSICEGDLYFAGGAYQGSGGTYTDVLVNSLGCDSVLTTHLAVLPNSASTVAVSICSGESYFVGGAWRNVSGSYSDYFINSLGCDSVRTTELTVLPKSYKSQNVSICAGDSLFAGGDFQIAAGVYVDTFTNYLGCDSMLTTVISILPKSDHTQSVSICSGESYFAGGSWQTAPGAYLDVYTNYLGCDSMLTTLLTILPETAHTQSVSICEGESFFAGGNWQTQGGTYTDVLTNAVGCDSVLTTILSVIPQTSFTQSISICEGESYMAGGALQAVSGIYTDVLTNAAGCDSVLTTSLTVLPHSFLSQNLSICDGDSIYLSGAYRKVNGTYLDTLQSFTGCDSMVTTALTVLSQSVTNQSVFICEGDVYYTGGSWQNVPGSYTDTLINIGGCDSVVITTLTVLTNSAFTQEITICNGQSFYCGGDDQDEAGVYNDTLSNAAGCDSVITTVLAVLPNATYSQSLSICSGDSVFIGGGWRGEPGIYLDHYTSYLGCDSAVSSLLNVLPVYAESLTVTICEGEEFFAGGAMQSQSGVYVDAFSAITGCDSVVSTILEVLPIPVTHTFPSVCDGEQFFAGGIMQAKAGIYYDTLQSMAGCDSIIVTHLQVNQNPVVELGNDTTLCEHVSWIIYAGDGYDSFLWQNGSEDASIEVSEEGAYWVTVTNAFGCSASDTVTVYAIHPEPDRFLKPDTVICGNLPVSVTVPGFEWYRWFDGKEGATYTFTNEGTYWLEVTDALGCRGIDSIQIENVCAEDFFMPNAFSPNGDGLNDEFLPVMTHPVSDFVLQIFNRWGMMVFESHDPAYGWNGYEGSRMGEMGAYVWKMNYTLDSGFAQSSSGNVLLLR